MRILVLSLIFMSCQATASGPKLYIFDCGLIELDSLEMFNLRDTESPVRQMFVPCYLIEHERGRLLFDGGLPKNIADSDGPVAIEGGSLSYDRWIVDQLDDIGLKPSDIDYATYSHLHFDHAGAANAFASSQVIMQRKEWDAAMASGGEFVDQALIHGLTEASISFIDGDYDVFGDGSVRLIFAPGHTPGHQLLMINLEKTGQLLISGDLYHTRANRSLRRAPVFNVDPSQTYESMDRVENLLQETGATLWIEHDKELADSLKKAPNFYE